MIGGMRLRPLIWGIGIAALAALILVWNATEGSTMSTQQGACAPDSRDKISEVFQAAFPAAQAPKVMSCDGDSTAWASFSHISAELVPASLSGLQGLEPLNDPGWFPMDLMDAQYRGAFGGADWTKVTSLESFDPVTKARIFLINAPDKRSFALITSE